MKNCKFDGCNQVNPQSFQQFNKQNKTKDGLRTWCKSCVKEYTDQWRMKNADKVNTGRLSWQRLNPEKCIESSNKWSAANRERAAANMSEWRLLNSDKLNFLQAKRRAAQLKRTPKWLSRQQWDQIREFYLYSSLMTETLGIPYEVDHIIPLQGKNVSGLHVPWNLQILTAKENREKHNSLINEEKS
jgi:hypothetical protein